MVNQGKKHSIEEIGDFDKSKIEKMSGLWSLPSLYQTHEQTSIVSARLGQSSNRRESLLGTRQLRS